MIRDLALQPISVSKMMTRLRGVLRTGVAACICMPSLAMAQSLPHDGTVVSGDVTIDQAGQGMTVTQGSNRAIVNWNSFSIGAGNHVEFIQPGANSVILNRVTGDTTSNIHGNLSSNGAVYLINPNGIFIGPTGTVDSQAFVASTLDMSNDDFNAGRLRFRGDGHSESVTNAGRVTIGRGGYAALLGGHVRNDGVVTVPMGRVAFGSGERVTLDLSGDQFLQVALPTGKDGEVLIDNAGVVRARGGQIEMRAATARHAVRHAINLSGVAEARSVSMHNGSIVLGGGGGGRVTVSGRVSTRSANTGSRNGTKGGKITVTGLDIALDDARFDASGNGGGGVVRIGGDFAGAGHVPHADRLTVDADTRIVSDALMNGDGGRIALWSDIKTEFSGALSARGGVDGGDGGFVEVSSKRTLEYHGLTDTRAPQGDWGMLLLDPGNITINPGGGGENALELTLGTTFATLDTSTVSGVGVGNITINADIDWTAGTGLYLRAGNNIRINAAINGPNGGLNIDAVGRVYTTNASSINVDSLFLAQGEWREVGANLTPITTNSFGFEVFGASLLRATGGSGSINDPYMIADIYGLQGVGSGSDADSHYALANDIDAGGTQSWVSDYYGNGFAPIYDLSGSLRGRGHTISDLYIEPSESEMGPADAAMFYSISSGAWVSNLSFTGARVVGADAAILAVYNEGKIKNVNAEGTIDTNGRLAGGLIAQNYGVIESSNTDVSITVDDEYYVSGVTRAIGGIAGYSDSVIRYSSARGEILLPGDMTDVAVGGAVGFQEGGVLRNINTNVDIVATGQLLGEAFVGGVIGAAGAANGVGVLRLRKGTASTLRNIRAMGDITVDVQASQAFGDLLYVGGQIGYLFGSSTLALGKSYGNIYVRALGGSASDVVVGGAVGWADPAAKIGQSRSMGDTLIVDFDGAGAVGGFIGGNEGTLKQSDTRTDVRVFGNSDLFVGGFAGGNSGTITRTAALGEVFVAISGIGDKIIGGHTGINAGGLIKMSYTIGELIVSGTLSGSEDFIYDVGLFVGEQYGHVYESYAARELSVVASPVLHVGFSGDFDAAADVEDVFYDSDLAGFAKTADGAIGLRTAQLQSTEFFVSTLEKYTARFALKDWAPGAAGYYPVLYNLVPVIFAEPNPLTVVSGNTGTATTTGTVFGGPRSYVFGATNDTVRVNTLFDSLVFGGTAVGNQVFWLATTSLNSTRGVVYRVIGRQGDATITAAPTPVPPTPPQPEPQPPTIAKVPPPPVVPPVVLPNPNDTISAGSRSIGVSDIAVAQEALGVTKGSSDALGSAIGACDLGGGSGDVGKYLSCVSEALDDFASALDTIAADLPPGMQNVAQIVQTARADIDRARTRALSRMANAGSDAERRAIRRDALAESTAALATASSEIRKAISLVRVDDPELASAQRATIVTASAAVDNVGIQLSRAVGL